MRIYELKPTTRDLPPQFEGLPYGFRVQVVGKPDQFGRVWAKDLQGKTLGLIPLKDLEALR